MRFVVYVFSRNTTSVCMSALLSSHCAQYAVVHIRMAMRVLLGSSTSAPFEVYGSGGVTATFSHQRSKAYYAQVLECTAVASKVYFAKVCRRTTCGRVLS